MLSTVVIVAGVLTFSAAIAIGWRILSRRSLLPCPSSLAWILENPLMEGVAGSEALLQRARVQPGMKVLDAGCGPGRLTIPLARSVGADGLILALDAQASMLAKLRSRLENLGIRNVRTIHAALGTGALGVENFDRAFLVTVLGEIPNQLAALREIYAHLHPGGILTVCEVLPDPHYQRQAVVRSLAEQIGFSVELVYRNYRSYTMNLRRPVPQRESEGN